MKRVEDRGGTQIATKVGSCILDLSCMRSHCSRQGISCKSLVILFAVNLLRLKKTWLGCFDYDQSFYAKGTCTWLAGNKNIYAPKINYKHFADPEIY